MSALIVLGLVFSVLSKQIGWKIVSDMIYFVWSGMRKLNPINQLGASSNTSSFE